MERILPGSRVLIRGAGEMATGVAHRLARAGYSVALTELPQPLAIRRAVCFSEAVWEGAWEVEGVRARRVASARDFDALLAAGELPVLADPELRCLDFWCPHALVDAALAKRNLGTRRGMAPRVIALGPGFEAGRDADVVVETHRGHDLGRLLFEGPAFPDTGVPGEIAGYAAERVLRAPADGALVALARIGDAVEAGQVVARVGDVPMVAAISGVLRGLLRDGTAVRAGMKAGDVDPRGFAEYCFTISDKARALGGSVLEALLTRMPS